MQTAVEQIDMKRHVDDLRESWQVKALIHTRRTPIGIVILSMLGHSFDDAMPVLLRIAFPGFTSIAAPFLCTAGRIARSGHIIADMVTREGTIEKNVKVFRNSQAMQGHLRKLADDMKLGDDDRRNFFAAAQRWVVCDYRLDPVMNPLDPDAKRLVQH